MVLATRSLPVPLAPCRKMVEAPLRVTETLGKVDVWVRVSGGGTTGQTGAIVLVPLFKGIGWLIAGMFTGIGWLVRHVFEFIAGMLKDSVRFVGAVIAWVVLVPLVMLNVVIGRWSGAGHFFRSMTRECKVGTTCLYRVLLQRPLRFLLLDGLLEGVEERVNEAMVAAMEGSRP